MRMQHTSRAGQAALAAAVTALGAGIGTPASAAGAAPAARPAPLPVSAQLLRPSTDFDGDGFPDLAAGVPKAPVANTTSAGSVSVVYGSATGLNRNRITTITQATTGVPGVPETGDAFGGAVAGGDLNGDGFADMAVGSPGEDDSSGHTDTGDVTLLLGGASGFTPRSSTLLMPADARSNGDRFGDSIAIGDFNGNGINDLAVMATGDDSVWDYYDGTETGTLAATATATATAGAVLLRPGPGHRLTQPQPATGPTPQAVSPTLMRAAAGDINGDGYTDLAITRLDSGTASVFFIPGSATGLRFDLLTTMTGGGRSIAVGDINGDGYDDAAIGQPVASESGTANILGGGVTAYYGSPTGLSPTNKTFLYQDSPNVPGIDEAGDALGTSICLGDVNGDGLADALTGAPGEDITTTAGAQTDAGAVWLFFGTTAGLTGTGSIAPNQNLDAIPGAAESGDHYGSVVTLTDYNHDGHADFAVGSDGENSGDGNIVINPGTTTGYTGTGALTLGPGTLNYPTGASIHIGDVLAS